MYLKFDLVAILLAMTFSFTGCSEIPNLCTDDLRIHFVDVGQADAIIIQTPDNKNMLIDAGETKDNEVIDYINMLGIDEFEIVVATHPHSDHISEMKKVINDYEINRFYMPSVVHTSKTYEKMIDALYDKNINVNEAKQGISDILGEDVKIDFLAPNKDYGDDLNNWSAVVMLTYGDNKFLFTGDAEEESEKEILSNYSDISADVLKIGHHGSSTSTSNNFLYAVNPKIAVISCGENNSYGHPHKETIQKLIENNIKTYITKDVGTIIIESDGKDLYVIN